MGKHARKNRYILTLLGRKLTAQQIAGATRILAEQQLNIDGIRRLTGRIPLDEKKQTYVPASNFQCAELQRTKKNFNDN